MLTALFETGLVGLLCAFTRWWTARFDFLLAAEPERPWRAGKEAEASDFGCGEHGPAIRRTQLPSILELPAGLRRIKRAYMREK